MSSASNAQQKINIEIMCSIQPEKGQYLSDLFCLLYPHALPAGSHSLNSIFVVNDDNLETFINELLKAFNKAPNYTKGDHKTSGVAIHVTDNNKHLSFIVLGLSLLDHIHKDGFEYEAAATILEELLHIRFFDLCEAQAPTPIDENHATFNICHRFLSEYLTLRWKYPILEKLFGPLTLNDEASQNTFNSASGLMKKLYNIIFAAATNKTSINDSCTHLYNLLYRKMFEPLARHAAGKHFMNKEQSIDYSPYGDQFYQQFISMYWNPILRQMELSFDAPDNLYNHIDKISSIATAFLQTIGVTYWQLEDKAFYYYFDTAPLNRRCIGK